ncbi:MAG TPA: DEAD/DEAH box helicase [Methanomassiliicoccales archaeon]|nr:DEAD/DEAH box helicase [Methanomassiliicoccales archaeon]HPR98925.1 DEAD/DEAH box helicase [Methanomassiliicoccales archaeon]
MSSFQEFGLRDEIMKAIERMGFVEPTPVQVATIPLTMKGKDVIAQAQTGTGKTAAFGIPILESLTKGVKPFSLILVPTRELGSQVSDELKKLAFFMDDVRVLPVYGGKSIDEQVDAFRKGVDIVVGTPGRVIDHLHRGTLALNEIEVLVLDEADRMLDMGFIEDIEYIVSKVKKQRQTMLFSATIPETIKEIAAKHMVDPETIMIGEEQIVLPTTKQVYFNIERKNKIWALCRVLDAYKPKAIVFVQTKVMVDILAKRLDSYGYRVGELHGDLTQARREKVLKEFREGKTAVLIATDVAARGLDIEGVTHVINYDIPEDPEVYVHRIGRTGRAGKEGIAITFITSKEVHLLKKINEFGVTEIAKEEVPESGRKDVIRKVMDFEDQADLFGMVLFKVVAGENEPVERADLLALLNRKMRIPELAIGNINVLKDRTEFEVHKDSAKIVLMELKTLRVGDKKLKVEIVHRELPPVSMQ